ncbi:PKD domain-containing protein [bacterium AH-315-C07]|nr:PKD domain-containing protein [bacterium AH-315-C07]
MKKILVALTVLLISINGYSQITINYDKAPEIGDTWTQANDTSNLSGINAGNADTAQSWNFMSLGPDYIDTLRFIAPQSTPYYSSYPTADMAIQEGNGPYIYAETDTNEFSITGYAVDPNTLLVLDPPIVFLRFPMNYLDDNIDTSGFVNQYYFGQFGYDSIKTVQTTYNYDTIDAWGTVQVPTGTYDVLRQKSVEWEYSETFAIGVATGNVWIKLDSNSSMKVEYSFLSNELNIQIVVLEVDSFGNTISAEYTMAVDTGSVSPFFTYAVNDSLVTFADSSFNNPTSWYWEFGDGDTSTTQNPSHIYAMSDDYLVCLTGMNANGGGTFCDTVSINIKDPVVPKFGWSADSLTVTFTDQSSNNPTAWNWTFGDGNVSPVQDPVHAYASFGTYYVCLNAVNNKGGDTYCDSVTVAPGTALIIVRDDAPRIGDVWVQAHDVTNLGSISEGDPGVDKIWDFSGLASDYVDSTLFLAPQSTLFDDGFPNSNLAILEPNQPYNYVHIDTNQAELLGYAYGPDPSQQLQYTPPEVTLNFPTTYLSNASSSVYSEYLFGMTDTTFFDSVRLDITKTTVDTVDGWGNVITPKGTYEALRNKSIAVTSTNIYGKGDITFGMWMLVDVQTEKIVTYEWLSKDLTIELVEVAYDTSGNVASAKYTTKEVTGRPSAYFTYNTNQLVADFSDSSYNDPTSWYWDFGDGDTALTETPSHAFAVSGTYNVCLYVTNSKGWGYYCDSVDVIFIPPVADFSYSIDSLTVSFIDLSYSGITDWSWDFGNGDTSNLKNPLYTYSAAGNYYVCLSVTKSGYTVTYCDSIAIDPSKMPPIAIFGYTVDSLTATFTDSSVNDPDNWLWTLGDGANSSDQHPVHPYAQEGIYNVCLTVTNGGGSYTLCDSVNIEIIVVTPPVASFTHIVDSLGVVTFSDQSSNNPDSWSWDFGDGNSSTLQNPNHTYVTLGTYNVCLSATNFGGTDTFCDSVKAVSSIGISKYEQLDITIFPIPSDGMIYVNLHNTAGDFVLSVVNILGERVYHLNDYNGNVLPIDLTDQPNGLYFVEIEKDQYRYSRKVLIQR